MLGKRVAKVLYNYFSAFNVENNNQREWKRHTNTNRNQDKDRGKKRSNYSKSKVRKKK